MRRRLNFAKLRELPAIFTVGLLVLFSIACIASHAFPFEGRIFPLTVGVFGMILAAASSIRTLFGLGDTESTETAFDLSGDLHIGVKLAYLRALRYTSWLVLFLLAMILFGAATASFAFVLVYLVIEARVAIWRSLLDAAVVTFVLSIYLANLLGLSLPRGLIGDPLRQAVGTLLIP